MVVFSGEVSIKITSFNLITISMDRKLSYLRC
jgi:hypothetical protein